MKKSLGILAIVAILLIVTVSFVSAGQAGPITPDRAPLTADKVFEPETFSAYFVEFKSAPSVDGTSSLALNAERNAFVDEADALGLNYTVRYTFSTLWNGMSVSIAKEDVNKLFTMGSVKAVYPVVEIKMPETTFSENPDLATAVTMTGADVAHTELGIFGATVKVAVMDTGIDYDHPDLGGCFGMWCKVFAGYDFVGDAYNADPSSPSYNPVPAPDNDPDDCNGHGTHVSGIVAANGTVVGVAPKARLGAYRVFGCEGSTESDIMLAAMERALADNMDVLNMSIGSAFQWPQYPTAVAANNLVDAGMVVVASIGNSGANGLYAAGAPGVGEKVIGVASFDNEATTLPYAIVEETEAPNAVDQVNVPFIPMTYSGPIPTSGTEPIVFVGRACNVTMGDTLLADPTGKIALIERGACSFNEKATFAINNGATGVVIHNNAPGLFSGTLGSVIDGVTPVVGISQEDGLYIRGLFAPTWTWTDQLGSFDSPSGGLISAFSSYGLAPDLSVKPDIGAPGGNIYSTYPLEKGGYVSMGGTSMSSPHVAGAVALLLDPKSVNTNWLNPTQIRTVLQNSADPHVWSLGPDYGLLDHVYRQGAGMVDIDDTILSDIIITPGKLALGEGSAGPSTHTLKITNNGLEPKMFVLDWVSAVAANGIIDIEGFWLTDEMVTFSQDQVYVAPGHTMEVDVTITPPTLDTVDEEFGVPWNTLYNGWIILQQVVAEPPEDGVELQENLPVYSVPYAGFAGDYQDIEHLNNPYGLPWLTYLEGDTFYSIEEGHVFNLAVGDFPWLLFHLDHQTPQFEVNVLRSMTGRRGFTLSAKIMDYEYVGRNSTTTGFFAEPWDGTRIFFDWVFAMPSGAYQMEVNVLKALGDPDNPDDWETWVSPMFYITREVPEAK